MMKTTRTINYRPISLVSAASKLLQIVALNNIETCIESSRNQFGFKSKHVTDMCIYSLKNVIQYNIQYNSPELMLLVLLIELITGHCLKHLPDEEFLCCLLDYYAFGTTHKSCVTF